MKISANICRPTLRGVGNRPPENSWFPLWLLNRHLSLQWDENPDFLFYGDINSGSLYESNTNAKRIFLTGENIQANWDETDYALTHERIWNERHWRTPLWRQFYDPDHTKVNRNFIEIKSRVDKFCNFIYSNDTAKERIEFFHLLSKYKHIDSGGKVLNNIGGRVEDKLAMLAQSKFTIAFENESHAGYATEKIIEPLLQGSIPIYWGDPFITEDFNPECFINVLEYNSFEEVIEEIVKIDNDDTLWEKYITAPIFRNGQIPERLSDAAYINFFTSVFSNHKAFIPEETKRQQKTNYFRELKRQNRKNRRSLISRIHKKLFR